MAPTGGVNPTPSRNRAEAPAAPLQPAPTEACRPSFPPLQFCLHEVPWLELRPHRLSGTGHSEPFTPQCAGVTDRWSRTTALPTRATRQPHSPCPLPHSQLRRDGSRAPEGGNPAPPAERTTADPVGGRFAPPLPAGGLGRMPAVGPCCQRGWKPPPPPRPAGAGGAEGLRWGAEAGERVAGAEVGWGLSASLGKSPRDNRLFGVRVTGELGAGRPDAVLT